jgi:DNA-binding transcriptional MerR regulator
MAEVWSITALAEEFGVTLRTIRHYEDVGLINPERRGTTRVFHARDRIRLQLILRGKRLGFSLPEIRTIVNMYDEQPGEAGQLQYLLDRSRCAGPSSTSCAATSTTRWPSSPTSRRAAARTSPPWRPPETT